jgi:hypothetical protein
MLDRLGFTDNAAKYMPRHAGMDSLNEVSFLDDGDVDTLIKRVHHPGGTTTVGTGSESVTTPNMGFAVSIRAAANLKICVFYFNYQTRVIHTPTVSLIDLDLIRGFHDQMKWEDSYSTACTLFCPDWSIMCKYSNNSLIITSYS